MQHVGMLDGLNRYQFGREAEMPAAWERARHVATGPRAEEPAAPAEGEVKPAA
jgi:hypothetical protein